MFILAAERDTDPDGSFMRYAAYLARNSKRFPSSACALATSDWYMNFTRHECPHDAWLEWFKIEEISAGERHEKRHVAITLKLLGAYHDGAIELHYPCVFEYHLNSHTLKGGHRNWRYDEFRVNDENHLIHEIEWRGYRSTGTWLIVASDIEYRWIPDQ